MTTETDAEARAMMQDRLIVRSALKEEHDQNFKIASYILAGHGAGMLACMVGLKDYKTTPELQGIGIFIVVFGLGLITSCLAYMCLTLFVQQEYRYVVGLSTKGELDRSLFGFNLMAYASMALMLIAVSLTMWKFYSL